MTDSIPASTPQSTGATPSPSAAAEMPATPSDATHDDVASTAPLEDGAAGHAFDPAADEEDEEEPTVTLRVWRGDASGGDLGRRSRRPRSDTAPR